jgi:hypothetical protein
MTEDLLLSSWKLIQQLGRVPRCLIWTTSLASAAAIPVPGDLGRDRSGIVGQRRLG